MIPFKQIPSNIRVPLFYAEVDPSQANTATQNQRTLIVGQQLPTTGTYAAGVPVLAQGVADVKAKAGQGSMLALMMDAYRKNDSFGEVWVLPLADDGAAVAATGTVTVGGPATANGAIPLYIAGQRVQQLVTSAQTAAQIATALAATINAIGDLPVTATAAAAVVTLTAKNKGLAGNDIDIRAAYLGAAGGEVLPAGVTLAFSAAQLSGGATNPSLTTGYANLGDQPFDFIVLPYTDTASLDATKALLDDVTGRWSWDRQVYGHFFAAVRGTVGTLTTFGTARNDQHGSVLGFADSPSPALVWAAAFAGAVAPSVRADPAMPLHTIAVNGVLAAPLPSRFILTDRNTLLFDGVSTFTVGDDGTVRLEGVITTYQKNGFGAPDNSYLQVCTLFNLADVLRRMKTLVTSKYGRVKLAADGTRFGPGSGIVTPSLIKADIIAMYQQLEQLGRVQGTATFKSNLVVEKNATDPNRVDVLYPAILINQLDVFALLAQFRLTA